MSDILCNRCRAITDFEKGCWANHGHLSELKHRNIYIYIYLIKLALSVVHRMFTNRVAVKQLEVIDSPWHPQLTL